jgi:hypothetical protein
LLVKSVNKAATAVADEQKQENTPA